MSSLRFLPSDEAGEKAKKEKDKSKPLPRIPGQRDASKKLSKIVSVIIINYLSSSTV